MWWGLLSQIWMCCKRSVLTTIGMRMRIEAYQILGQGSRDSLYWKINLRRDIHGPGGDSQKIKQLPDPKMCGLKSGRRSEKLLRKEKKQEWAKEKLKSDNARRLRGIYFIDPHDGDYKDTLRNARRRRQCLAREEREVKQAHRNRERKMTNPARFQRQNMLVLWTSWVHELTFGIMATKASWRCRCMGSPRQVVIRRRRTREGPELACVRSPFDAGVPNAGGEGRINVLAVVPCCRRGLHLQWDARKGGKTGLPASVSGRHEVRESDTPHLSLSRTAAVFFYSSGAECARVTGKAGENCHKTEDWAAALTLDKTVGSRVWWHIQGLSELRKRNTILQVSQNQ